MYHYWVQEYLRVKKQELEGPAEAYNKACSDYSQMKQEIDCHVARGADIIGMTTTGAAKYHHILNNIHPKIVIIEEAAEVFESHVITSLSPSVQQLILIGDHKQLRPKPNHYELEKKYDLHVSLFQRLIENDIPIPHVTLTVQHRMRPDIASLIHPAIYSELQNGPRAIEHGKHKIAGVGHNLFFLHHEHPEKQQNPNESLSHVNIHEADFMVALCRYLTKQGYETKQITLLTMYKGQLLQMKSRMRRSEFDGVRVAAVDDFQGEENDIILLSLVRSNSDGNIGFLKIENRVCVALSRARKGLYVIGNFAMLRSRDGTIWPTIISVVEEKKCIGEALLLQCQNHPQEVVRAKVASDFSKCPEGGCTRPCDYRLKCGHGCTRLCHPWDREHKLFKCQKKCGKPLPCRHGCKRKCYECTGGCGPCEEEVERRVPRCGHQMRMKCQQNLSMYSCSAQCQKPLRCGHFCQRSCSEPCDTRCSVKVEKALPCGHNATVPCHKSVEQIQCLVPCNTLLQCEHECKGTCGLCQQGRLHIHCGSECGRTLVCGHICHFPCAAECPPCTAKCSNYCPHSKCPKNCYEPCDPCAEPCQWNCDHLKCTKKCGELCNRPRCDMPCLKRLRKCGHPCIGLCGDKCPKLCRVCDNDKVTEIFFGKEDEPDARFVQLQDCKHVFEYTGLDQWMDREESEEIQFKKCPRCSTLIRTSLRYYNEVKKVHNHFEEIKKKQLQVSNIGQVLMPKLRELKSKGGQCVEVTADVKKIQSLLSPGTRPRYILPHCLNAIQNQLAILPTIVTMYNELTQVEQKSWQLRDCKIKVETIHQQLQCVQEFLMQDSLTDQQLSDIQCEIRRLNCTIRLLKLHSLIKERKITITLQEKQSLDEYAQHVYRSGAYRFSIPKVSEEYFDWCYTIS
ncbi:NFX1-type zinc finger-containing protein 1 [Geodia barretti]|uniref:NFX1-type zinc finger-containing protein 1 n=2 Tax=Geodia barretti TaxID=519541 RepID=A0AA35WHI0_GEOBA|nr:NFX1-type zinc finger-containing protein 1 [Geodia barretti]